jgi:hypothetical protein
MGVLVRELVAKQVSLIPLRLNFATTFGSIPRKRSTCLLLARFQCSLLAASLVHAARR